MRATNFGLLLAIAGVFTGSAADSSASIVLDLSGGSAQTALSGSAGTAGWLFTVHAPITIEGLGIWDEGANGLAAPHQVGLWTLAGSLVASITVNNSGTAVPSSSGLGQWLFGKVSPHLLNRGEYVLGAFYEANDPDEVRVLTDATTIPNITFGTARTLASPGLAFPSGVDSAQNDGVFGPNIFIASATSEEEVPEPATVVAWSVGALAALVTATLRSRAAKAT